MSLDGLLPKISAAEGASAVGGIAAVHPEDVARPMAAIRRRSGDVRNHRNSAELIGEKRR